MKKVILKQGQTVLISDEDFEKVSKHKWFLSTQGYPQSTPFNRKKKVNLHRFILQPPEDKVVDHINHNKLDNRRENLRICTQAENAKNVIKRCDNTSGTIGVNWINHKQKWRAYINRNGKQIHLGLFEDKILAIMARKKAEIIYI